MVIVRWTNQSINDIQNIAEYISKDSLKYARLQVNAFFDRCKILEQFPLSGRIVPEIENENIRELIVGSYRIIYLLRTEKSIDILTVHHSYKLLKL
jgi:addiction module RelE/StbE family toxin